MENLLQKIRDISENKEPEGGSVQRVEDQLTVRVYTGGTVTRHIPVETLLNQMNEAGEVSLYSHS